MDFFCLRLCRMDVYIESASYLQCSAHICTIKVNYLEIMHPNYMETVNGGPKTFNVEQEHGKPECFQCALFWYITPSDKWIIWLLLLPTSSNCIICCACVSRIMLCGKLLLGITLIICNENKYNSTVDFNKLTQFSTSCLMWLKQSNYTAFPPRFAWAHNWIFQCVCLTSYWSIFSSVVVINMHLKVKQWFPRCFDIKKLFSYLCNPHYSSVELMVSWYIVAHVDSAHVVY